MIDAVSFVMSAVRLTLIRTPASEPAVAARKESAISQIRDGVAVVLDGRLFRALVGASAIDNLFSHWVITLFAPFAARVSYPHRGGTQ